MNKKSTLSMSIMSGKGGVGKTNIALNLGLALNSHGFAPLLIDCDLGLANLDVLLGVAPPGNLQSLLTDNVNPKSILLQVAQGFDIMPAASGVPELVDMDGDTRSLLLSRLASVLDDYEFVLLDLGAGITPTVQDFARMTAIRVMILTPEPTSLTDSYALIKVLSTRHGVRDFWVVINQVESRKEGDATFNRLKAACEHFLKITPLLLGTIRADKRVPESVRKQTPFLRLFPTCGAAMDIMTIAERIAKIRQGMSQQLAKRAILDMSARG
jgi:flagellar biosynthesis protein FlhG